MFRPFFIKVAAVAVPPCGPGTSDWSIIFSPWTLKMDWSSQIWKSWPSIRWAHRKNWTELANTCIKRPPKISIASDTSKRKYFHSMWWERLIFGIIFSAELDLWKSLWRQWIYFWWLVMPKHWICSSNLSWEWFKNSWKTPIPNYRFWLRIRLVITCVSNARIWNKIHNSCFSLFVSQILKRTLRHTIDDTISSFRNSLQCVMATTRISNCETPFVWRAFGAYKVWFVKPYPMIWLRTFGTNSIWRRSCHRCYSICRRDHHRLQPWKKRHHHRHPCLLNRFCVN